jgi:hypothetical protein
MKGQVFGLWIWEAMLEFSKLLSNGHLQTTHWRGGALYQCNSNYFPPGLQDQSPNWVAIKCTFPFSSISIYKEREWKEMLNAEL